MRTGLTKKQKTTVIYFDEHSRIIEVQTHNTDLKKRLTAFSAKHPQCCRQTDDGEQGGLTFEIADYEDAFRNALGAKRSAEVKKELAAKRRTLQKSENRLAELDKLFKRIYEDMVNGKLSEARFQMLSDDYEQEQEELRAKIEMLENEIQNQEDQAENVDRFIREAKKHLYLEKLTPNALNDMVQAVYVHAPDNSSGQRIQNVDISYNYIGILPENIILFY